VPTYGYRCGPCGDFELVRPMAEAAAETTCPACGAPARRVFGAPALRALSPGLRNALDAGERSADAPDVVTSVPAAGRRGRNVVRTTTDPRHARLPRP
jgi:putative FmdB family regulatory protein